MRERSLLHELVSSHIGYPRIWCHPIQHVFRSDLYMFPFRQTICAGSILWEQCQRNDRTPLCEGNHFYLVV